MVVESTMYTHGTSTSVSAGTTNERQSNPLSSSARAAAARDQVLDLVLESDGDGEKNACSSKDLREKEKAQEKTSHPPNREGLDQTVNIQSSTITQKQVSQMVLVNDEVDAALDNSAMENVEAGKTQKETTVEPTCSTSVSGELRPPTTTLQRDGRSGTHHSRMQPGVYSVQNSEAQRVEWRMSLSDQPSGTALTLSSLGSGNNITLDIRNAASLPTALRVSETGAPPVLGTAQEVNMGQLEASLDARNCKRRKTICHIALGGTILLAFIVLLGLIFGIDNDNQAESSSSGEEMPATEAPSRSPTASPTILADTWNGLPDSTLDALEDPDSPQALAYDWILSDSNLTSYPAWKVLQRFALAVFYFSTGGEDWILNTDWLGYDLDECSWYFKKLVGSVQDTSFLGEQHEGASAELQFADSVCNSDGKYKYLVFTENNMDGTLPPEISLLSDSLLYLEVGSNENLYGWIPSEIGLLTNLQKFYADRNQHSGQLPTEMGQLSNLQELELGYNPFTGSLPSEMGNMEALYFLSVRRCFEMSGTLPTELYKLTNMATFYVHGLKSVTGGKLLPEIGRMTKLESFVAHHIPFNTSILTEFGLLSDLFMLNLWQCHMTGTVPSELFLLTNLKNLDIDDNTLTGTIATEFGLFPNMTTALLNGNFFTGTLAAWVHF
ncbi:Leucine Rich Repeat [Seminavis robusta]|uniref:Leucine Rich Repeat n=1 Tax=Seminavis robusta TaxID=568900 RepID=A0A9N8DX76_9STRA|nr:Leucine Rich Repeat [Seminavis robusta]|eukprot:Sro341_g121400.1 Leucine Rich Repeat (668) ;mRNA; f:19634-21819